MGAKYLQSDAGGRATIYRHCFLPWYSYEDAVFTSLFQILLFLRNFSLGVDSEAHEKPKNSFILICTFWFCRKRKPCPYINECSALRHKSSQIL